MREMPLLLPNWPAPENVRAAATTREGGVSRGAYASLNLGAKTDDSPEAIAANRRLLRGRLGLEREPAWLDQVHGTTIVRADDVGEPPAADGSWTSRPGVACVVLVADCLPVLFCDRAGTRVAAVHGGWRGLAGNILGRAVEALGLPGEELVAWLGPAMGPDAFEVGPEVRAALVEQWPDSAAAFRTGQGDRWFCDLHEVARTQLAGLGVHEVSAADHCTSSEPDRFYSFRRDGRTGRMAALVWLESSLD